MDYLKIGYDLLTSRQGDVQIMSAVLDGQKIWIKKASPSKKTFWHFLQGGLAVILKQPMIKPTVIDGGADSFRSEIAKLKSFKEAGVLVPDVYAADDTIIVMADIGLNLETVLNENRDPEFRKNMLQQAIKALASLHKKGLVHGKPYLRDMALNKDGMIGFLDLEENPQEFMSLAQAQARDVWLFLSFAAKYARDPQDKYKYDSSLIGMLYEIYKSSASAGVLAELKQFVSFLNPLAQLLENRFFWRKIGSDARRAVMSTLCLCNKSSSKKYRTV